MLTRSEKIACTNRFRTHFKLSRNAADVLIRKNKVEVTLNKPEAVPVDDRIEGWENMQVVWTIKGRRAQSQAFGSTRHEVASHAGG